MAMEGYSTGRVAVYNECATPPQIDAYDDSKMSKIFHPLLALIASATDNELAQYVEYFKEENKILRARIPGQIHTRPNERERLLRLGKVIGRAIEELITIVTPATFYRWIRDEKSGKPRPTNPKGGQRKPREIRELVIKWQEPRASDTPALSASCGNWASERSVARQSATFSRRRASSPVRIARRTNGTRSSNGTRRLSGLSISFRSELSPHTDFVACTSRCGCA